MNFLFTVALNNRETATGYKTIFTLFNSLALTLISMGHNAYILVNPDAFSPLDNLAPYLKILDFNEDMFSGINFKPNYAFIWNGNTQADILTIKCLNAKNIGIIYGELGFFNHYNRTCYFDFNGVNAKSSLMSCDISANYDQSHLHTLIKDNIKPRLFDDPYIFVPLQLETDTQIVSYSPFKTMDSFLDYVGHIFKNTERKILFKNHPRSKTIISPRDNMIEVYENVHHYIPYADLVIGINSTVLTETLLYHNNIMTIGVGITSRKIEEKDRIPFINEIYHRQLNWCDLDNAEAIRNSYFYKTIVEKC